MIDRVPFDVQIAVWGCETWARTGKAMLERSAAVLEDRAGTLAYMERLWDHDGPWLQSIERYIDNVRRDAPSWWALPWVVEARLSQKEPSAS